MKDIEKQIALAELIQKDLDGLLTDQEFADFHSMLNDDEEAVNYYVKTMLSVSAFSANSIVSSFKSSSVNEKDFQDDLFSRDMWTALAEYEKTAPIVEIEKPAKIPVKMLKIEKQPRDINKFSLYSAIISAAALIFVLIYVNMTPVKTAPLVGQLSKTVDAQWQDASGQIVQGCDLYAGPMNLKRGFAEIVLDEGAVIVVQAPALFTLESTQQIYLQQGQLVARMNGRRDQAFLVRTPHASVVDYGTEFGVRVDSAGQTETYVYEGQVQLRNSSNPIKFMKSLFLESGQGAEADTESNLRNRQVNPNAFVRSQELETHYLAQNNKGYYRWRASIYRLHRDPSLVAHYFFEKSSDNPQLLANSVFPGRQRMQGTFGDVGRSKPTWVEGRWSQKDGVRFERAKKQVIVIPSNEIFSFTQPLTISTWFYFPNADQWGGHLVSCRGNERANYQFSVFDKNYKYQGQQSRFEFIQYADSPFKDKGFYSRPFVPESGKWYHVAVVYDESILRFYVNGELFQRAFYEGMPESAPAEVIIGAQKKEDEYILETGDFDGVIDELMLFNRDLSEQEIRAIYEAGIP